MSIYLSVLAFERSSSEVTLSLSLSFSHAHNVSVSPCVLFSVHFNHRLRKRTERAVMEEAVASADVSSARSMQSASG